MLARACSAKDELVTTEESPMQQFATHLFVRGCPNIEQQEAAIQIRTRSAGQPRRYVSVDNHRHAQYVRSDLPAGCFVHGL